MTDERPRVRPIVMIDERVSHYRILEKLGGGGMGVVYRAEDTRLRRTVALKFLPPELTRDENAKARFMQEARAASALDHPNICTVHEIDETPDGQMFLAMAYYDGETLKEHIQCGPCSIEEVVDIGCQIAEGLAKAHAHGIVHRDIKPANIMVTRDGLAKIVDFGLAKLPEATILTQTGLTQGTVAYMAPEQARGESVDHRADLWALGVVLYEMITGRQPFHGDSAQALIYTILHGSPAPMHGLKPTVPGDFERIVLRALAKDVAARYQHADDLLADLRALKRRLESSRVTAKTAGRRIPSLAVLPFSDMSPQKDQDYFCEGMAEELINALSQLDGLRVASRTSAFQFKGRAEDIRRIGDQLDVETVLEGSVRKAGNRLRITAQLVSVTDGYHFWSDRYDRDMDDVFAIQDEITRTIVDQLKVKLMTGSGAPLVARSTQNAEAYNLYLKGRYYWNKRTADGLKMGIEQFQRAIDADPGYGLAYVGLADSYNMLGAYAALAPGDAFPRARAAATRALELDDMLAEAHTSLAFATLWFDWDWPAAERGFRRSIELNANYATAHNWYAEYLEIMGRSDEAIAEAERARALDPLSLILSSDVGWHCFFARRYDEALQHLSKALDMDPHFAPTRLFLGQVYEQQSRLADAIREFEAAVSLSGDVSRFLAALGHAYARAGEHDQARKMLQRLLQNRAHKYVAPNDVAMVYVGLGEKDLAFEWLERACEERGNWLLFVNVDPRFDPLRDDPRFDRLLHRMGLAVGRQP